MYLKRGIITTIELADQIFTQVYLRFFREKNSLITFLFHSLSLNGKESSLDVEGSKRGITIQRFRQFVEYFLDYDYIFISPDDILNGLNDDKKYVLITFDEGYFNNQYALPVLKEFEIPAVFFISANHVKYNKCFWWDAIYRERKKLGISAQVISNEINKLKSKTNEKIEEYIINRFGEEALEPTGNIDRPFTPSELKDFSKEKFVFLGNHTSDHAILTNYSPEEIKSQILSAQKTIYDITGITPIIISYPNGTYSKEVVRISKEIGLKLGITVDFKKNYLPIDFRGDDPFCLGRFFFYENNRLLKQCEMFRSDIELMKTIKRFLKKSS